MTTPADRKRAAQAVLAANAASDAATLRTLLADDVMWWVPPSAGQRYARPTHGRAAVVELLAGPSQMYDKSTIRWTVHHAIVEGDIAMLNASMTAVLRNGRDYANDYCFVFRFADALICEAIEYADTAHAMQLAGGATARAAPPAPASISEAAQRVLSSPTPYKGAAVPASIADTEGWLRYIEAGDAGMRAVFEARLPKDLPYEQRETAIDGVHTYVMRANHVADASDTPILVYIHGGALVLGGGDLAALMAIGPVFTSDMIVYSVDYRMPPLHPYPASLDDCLAVYRHVLTQRDPRDIFVGGGSAGGNLAAALVLRAKDEGLPMPAGLLLHTPEVDLTESGDTFTTNLGIDHVLGLLLPVNRLYANGEDLSHPYLSPLFGDLSGFPPTFLQAGTRDLFLSNTVRMHRRLRDASVDAELHVWEAMPHGGFGGTPEDDEIAAETRRFLDKHRRR